MGNEAIIIIPKSMNHPHRRRKIGKEWPIRTGEIEKDLLAHFNMVDTTIIVTINHPTITYSLIARIAGLICEKRIYHIITVMNMDNIMLVWRSRSSKASKESRR